MKTFQRSITILCLAAFLAPRALAAKVTKTAKTNGPNDSAALISPTTKAGLPDDLKQKLNQPLVPTPTDAEKKMAPTVKKAEAGFFLFVWGAILLEKMGLAGNK